MSRSIVIVDDEKLVIYGVRSLLSEGNSPYDVTGSFRNGEDGLRFCLENPPDLLLTDIGMPGMNGLELIREIRRHNKVVKIVVLSCHDEYKLVHEAFLLGADDYILKKDIEKESLYGMLEHLLPEKDGSEAGRPNAEFLLSLTDLENRSFAVPGFLGVIGFKGATGGADSGQPWQPDIPMLHQVVRELIEPDGVCYAGKRNDLVFRYPVTERDGRPEQTLRFENIRLTVSKYINRPVYVAQHAMVAHETLGSAYRTGLKILDTLFYYPSSAVLRRKTAESLSENPLSFSMTAGRLEESWLESLSDFLAFAEDRLLDPEAVKAEIVFALEHLLHHLRENTGAGFVEPSQEGELPYYQEIGRFSDLAQMSLWTQGFLRRISGAVKQSTHYNNAVSAVKLYVAEHLQEDLRLNTVSTLLHMSANYVSTVFKRTTGVSYIEHVNNKRVEHACELLETTDLTAKEISSRCGYFNPNYFSRIFKKVTQSTVSEYRRSTRR